MKKAFVISSVSILLICCISVSRNARPLINSSNLHSLEDSLRFLYSQSSEKWPAPTIDSGLVWDELGPVPTSPLNVNLERVKEQVELGKTLFFDPRLSSSKQISCATCHVPGLSWTDGREKSAGHNQQLNKRNSPGLLNVWFYKSLFWDGRSHSLEDQAFSPINSESEMHSSMSDAIRTLRSISGYSEKFEQAFGNAEISPETITAALAVFQRSLVSQPADFDRFLNGDQNALSTPALKGLHLFRTKARCMNCHNGPLFTDNSFHNIGFSDFGQVDEDLGRYNVTHNEEDAGKFRTASLRDVMRTGPWMHNGLHKSMDLILAMYSAGMPPSNQKSQASNELPLQKPDRLIKKLDLSAEERNELLAFLFAITASPPEINLPKLPGLD